MLRPTESQRSFLHETTERPDHVSSLPQISRRQFCAGLASLLMTGKTSAAAPLPETQKPAGLHTPEPVPAPQPNWKPRATDPELAKLVAELNDDSFDIREQAEVKLVESLGKNLTMERLGHVRDLFVHEELDTAKRAIAVYKKLYEGNKCAIDDIYEKIVEEAEVSPYRPWIDSLPKDYPGRGKIIVTFKGFASDHPTEKRKSPHCPAYEDGTYYFEKSLLQDPELWKHCLQYLKDRKFLKPGDDEIAMRRKLISIMWQNQKDEITLNPRLVTDPDLLRQVGIEVAVDVKK